MPVERPIERILNLIEEHGITAYKLLSDIGLSSARITQWKNGAKPSAEAILKIARYFNVSTDYLISGEERRLESDNFENEQASKVLMMLEDLGKLKKEEMGEKEKLLKDRFCEFAESIEPDLQKLRKQNNN